jgi:hypothetical protein
VEFFLVVTPCCVVLCCGRIPNVSDIHAASIFKVNTDFKMHFCYLIAGQLFTLQINRNEMNRACSTHERDEKCVQIIIKPEWMKLLGRHWPRREDNIKTELKK